MQDDANVAPAEEAVAAPVDPGQEGISKEMPATEVPEQEQLAAEPAPEGAETAEPSQVTNVEPEEEIDWSQYVPKLNTPLPADENGQVDPNAFREQMKQELRFEQQQIRSWTRLETQYPEIRKDAGLRDMIVANQLYDVQRGGNGSLESAAKSVFDRIGVARNEGKASQAASVTVQKSAALEKPTGRQVAPANSDTLDRIRRGDQGAIQSQLADWISQGKI